MEEASVTELIFPCLASAVDPDESHKVSSSEKKAKIVNQRERSANALMLSRQGPFWSSRRSSSLGADPPHRAATTLLERTRLNVTIVCQAIHAKTPRHMYVPPSRLRSPRKVSANSLLSHQAHRHGVFTPSAEDSTA